MRPRCLGAVLAGVSHCYACKGAKDNCLHALLVTSLSCVSAQVSNLSMQLTRPSQPRQAVLQSCLLWLS